MGVSKLRPILLVEDSPKDIELTLAALRGSQLVNEVVVLRDGADALDYLYRRGAFAGRQGQDPVVVILDIRMPRVNGLEVLATLKGDPALSRMPVLMLTSSTDEMDLLRSHDLRANAFVTKPVGFQEFFEAIQSIGAFWAVLNEPPPEQ